MKNKKSTLLIILGLATVCIILLITLIVQQNKINDTTTETMETSSVSYSNNYDEVVKSFNEVGDSELKNLDENKEDYYIYVGEKDCIYCQEAAPKIKDILENTHNKIFYVDSSKETNEGILKNLNIKFVPYIAKVSYDDGEKTNEIFDERYMYLPKFLGYRNSEESMYVNDSSEYDIHQGITYYNLSIESRINALTERINMLEDEDLDDNALVDGITSEIDSTVLYVQEKLTEQNKFLGKDSKYTDFITKQKKYIENSLALLTKIKDVVKNNGDILSTKSEFKNIEPFDSYSMLSDVSNSIGFKNYFGEYQRITEECYHNYL